MKTILLITINTFALLCILGLIFFELNAPAKVLISLSFIIIGALDILYFVELETEATDYCNECFEENLCRELDKDYICKKCKGL